MSDQSMVYSKKRKDENGVVDLKNFPHYNPLKEAEKLIFEMDNGTEESSGVDLPHPEKVQNRLGTLKRVGDIGLPGLSEPQVVRHYVRLSQKNYAIDAGIYPLGSCTMKHNPRLNEKLSRLQGFADIHPFQPESTVQGALELIDKLSNWIKELTGMHAVSMSPAAGAHGELCGMMAIRAALQSRGDGRSRILVPDSAHGTNPSTAAICGYKVDAVPSDNTGRINLAAFREKLGSDVAALMLTNPNTCGLFEKDILSISEELHEVGGFLYCDGANFNAIVGKVRPGDLGIDAMHLNLHKTFSTPHGGGGPGSGPVVVSKPLAPFLPLPFILSTREGYSIVEQKSQEESLASFGRLKAFHGQMGMFIRALAYIMSHGADGLRQVAEDAVLNANYISARLRDDLSLKYSGPCMHEVVFDDAFLEGTGISTHDFAKGMIDLGLHPMTIYFPLIVNGAMLTEPTESESKQSLDAFCEKMSRLAHVAKNGNAEEFINAPHHAPVGRLNEAAAARKPILRWQGQR